MTGKKTLTLTEIPTRKGVSIIQDMAVAYGTDEKIVESDGLAVPKHGFFAASLNNFDGFPDSGTIDVGEDFVGGAYIFNEARITPTVSLKPEKGEGACLAMYDNAYAADALFTNEYSTTPCILGDNAVVRGGEHYEIWVEGNGYVEGTKTKGVYVGGSARLINAGTVSPSMFGGDTEVNLTGVAPGARNAATMLLAIGALEWDLSKAQPLKSDKEHPRLLTGGNPQNMWGTLEERQDAWYLYQTAKALKEAPAPEEVTMCLSSTLHKKHKEHCKCMFYYALYLLADPVALHYFARLEGNAKAVESSPLALVPNGALEDTLMRRTIELDKETRIEGTNTALDVFMGNLVIPVEKTTQMRGFKQLVSDLETFNVPASFESAANEALWYLNYLYVTFGITPKQFFARGIRKSKPDKRIMEMTARTRGII